MPGHDLLEEVAQHNALVQVNPYTKLLMGLGSIILVLFSPNYFIPLAIAGILSLVLLTLARIHPHFYLRVLAIPLGFAVMSVMVIVLTAGGNEPLWNFPLTSWVVISITPESLHKGIMAFCRIIGGMCALFFISLTTPMTDLFGVMKRLRIPDLFIDIAMLIYRFIFIFMDRSTEIYQAQIMRGSYTKPKESIRSLGMLIGSLFITSWDDGEHLVRAMDARCYTGRHPKLSTYHPVSPGTIVPVLCYLALFSTLILASPGYLPGIY